MKIASEVFSMWLKVSIWNISKYTNPKQLCPECLSTTLDEDCLKSILSGVESFHFETYVSKYTNSKQLCPECLLTTLNDDCRISIPSRQHCCLNICCYIGWIDKYWDGGSKPSQGPVEFSKGYKSKRSSLRRILFVNYPSHMSKLTSEIVFSSFQSIFRRWEGHFHL